MAKFITADTHFGHGSILNSCKNTRGHFKSVDQMNESIIKNWNNVVGGEDTIYHLGDIAVNISNQSLFEILKKLNGKIIFIKGNHDEQNRFNWLERHNYEYAKGMKFSFHEVGTIITENKKEYYLTQYPMDLGYQTKKEETFMDIFMGTKLTKNLV